MAREATPNPCDKARTRMPHGVITPADRWESAHIRSVADTQGARHKTGDIVAFAIISLVTVVGVALLTLAIVMWSMR